MTTIAPIDHTAPIAPDSPPPVSTTLTVLEPPLGWQVINARELWKARELIFFLAWRDVKVRYKQTVLGAAWAVLQPLMMMVVFSIFFGRMAGVPSGGVPYPLFVLSGLLPWSFFASAVTSAANSVVGSERLITKIYFPRLAVPLASVGSAVVDFAVACFLLGLMMAWYGAKPGPGLLLAPVVFGLIAVLALGLGTLLAALNVAYRDFKHVIPFMIQIGMFATPTVYMDPSATASGRYTWLLALNPMSTLVASFRTAILGGTFAWGSLALAAVASFLVFFAGCLYFRRVEDSFADVI
jgi:lipopolysaccharide transport system permease protein